MTRKREPEALPLTEGGWLVKHTHDLDLAARLVRAGLVKEEGLTEDEAAAVKLDPRPIWCRILGALPGSCAEAEGWGWEYRHASGPARGAFRAVEFPT